MVWEFSIFIVSLAYAGVLWYAYTNPANFILPGLIFLLAVLGSTKIIAKKYIFSIIPLLLAIGSILLLPLIDSFSEAKAFIALSAGVFYLAYLGSFRLSKYSKDKTAKGMLNLALFATLFSWFASGYGWYLNVQMPVWILMAIYAFVTFIISFVSFDISELELIRHQKILFAVFLAYLMAGTVWMQSFWPFGYLTTGTITLIIYYSGWDIVSSNFLKKLSLKRLFFDIIFLLLAGGIMLATAKWYPAI